MLSKFLGTNWQTRVCVSVSRDSGISSHLTFSSLTDRFLCKFTPRGYWPSYIQTHAYASYFFLSLFFPPASCPASHSSLPLLASLLNHLFYPIVSSAQTVAVVVSADAVCFCCSSSASPLTTIIPHIWWLVAWIPNALRSFRESSTRQPLTSTFLPVFLYLTTKDANMVIVTKVSSAQHFPSSSFC